VFGWVSGTISTLAAGRRNRGASQVGARRQVTASQPRGRVRSSYTDFGQLTMAQAGAAVWGTIASPMPRPRPEAGRSLALMPDVLDRILPCLCMGERV